MSAHSSWPDSAQDPFSAASKSRRRSQASRRIRTGNGKPEIRLFRQADFGGIRKAVTTVLALPVLLALAGCVGGTQAPLLELFPPDRQEMPGAPETEEETPAPLPDPRVPEAATEEAESETDTRGAELAPSPPPVPRSSPPSQAPQTPTSADGNSVTLVDSSEPQSARQTRETRQSSSSSVPNCRAGWGGAGTCKLYNTKVLADFRNLVGRNYIAGAPHNNDDIATGGYLSRWRHDGYVFRGWGMWAEPKAPTGRGSLGKFGLFVNPNLSYSSPYATGSPRADNFTIATGTGTATWRGGLIATDFNDTSFRPIFGKTKVTMDLSVTSPSMKVNFTSLNRVNDDTTFTSLGNLPEATLTRVTDKNLWVTSGSPATSLTSTSASGTSSLRVMGSGDPLVPINGSKTATDEVTAAFFNPKPGDDHGAIWGTVTSDDITGVKLNGSWAAIPE